MVAMMQMDMNAWTANSDAPLYFVSDDTSNAITRFSIDLINAYGIGTYKEDSLPPGATSDHRSFYSQGFPTVFPFENPQDYNSKIHTAGDTPDNLNNLEFLGKFIKLGTVFLVHMGGSSSLNNEYEESRKGFSSDIKIWLSTKEIDAYDLYLSTPDSISKAYYCYISTKNSGSCQSEIIYADSSQRNEGRMIHIFSDGIVLKSPTRIRLVGLDKNDKQSYLRDIIVEQVVE